MSRLGARRPHNILGPDLAWVMGILCVCTAARAQPAGQPQPAQPARVQPQAAPPAAAPAAPAAAAEAARQDAASTENLTLRDAPELKDPLTVALTPKSGGLTADEVARRAVVASDSLAAKRAAIEAAAAKVDEAVARFLPRLTLKAGYTRLSRVENSLSTGGGGLVGGNGTLLEVGPCPPGYTPTAAGATGCVQNAAIIDLQFPVLVNNYSLSANLGVPFSDYLLRLSSSIATTKHEKRAAELSASAEKRKIAAESVFGDYRRRECKIHSAGSGQ